MSNKHPHSRKAKPVPDRTGDNRRDTSELGDLDDPDVLIAAPFLALGPARPRRLSRPRPTAATTGGQRQTPPARSNEDPSEDGA